MLLVRTVSGPARAIAGGQAVYRSTSFNEPEPAPDELQQINWRIESAGETLADFRAAGAELTYDVPDDLAGRTIRVMAYRNSPTPRVSVVTSIQPVAREAAEGGADLTSGPMLVTLFRDGARYSAAVNGGERYFVGTDVGFMGNRGLMNIRDTSGARYDPADYRQSSGFWSDFVHPTALCESNGFFNRINTYDRAHFTFGFFQYAAHTPNANFVLLFRDLLGLPAAGAYFPDLTLRDELIVRQSDCGTMALETENTTRPLMEYLNPSVGQVEDIEVINAAKFIHWSQNDAAHRELQVRFTIDGMKRKMGHYAGRYNLHGMADKICLVIADIRHQGRAKSTVIIEALQSNDSFGSLLRIGEERFGERIATLGNAIENLENKGLLGQRKYDRTNEDFVPI